MPKELPESDDDDSPPPNSNVTLLGTLASIAESINLSRFSASEIFKKQHLLSAHTNLQALCDYIDKNKCNFIVFDNPTITKT